MDLPTFAHTKKFAIKKIYTKYLQGYSEEEISIMTDFEIKEVSNVIDCYNYLYV